MPHSPQHMHDGADAARSGMPTGQRPEPSGWGPVPDKEPLTVRMREAILKRVPSLNTPNSIANTESRRRLDLVVNHGYSPDDFSRWPNVRDDVHLHPRTPKAFLEAPPIPEDDDSGWR